MPVDEARMKELLHRLGKMDLPPDVRAVVDTLLMELGETPPPRKSVGPPVKAEFEKLRDEIRMIAKIATAIDEAGQDRRAAGYEDVAWRLLAKARGAGSKTPLGGVTGPGTPRRTRPEDNPRLAELTRTLMDKVKQATKGRRGGV